MSKIHSFINNISRISGKFVSYLILPLIVLIVYSVFMRYVIKDAPIWSFEVPVFIFGSYFMLGGAYCLLTNSHVNVDIFPRRLSQNGQTIIGLISNIVILIVCIIIVIQSATSAWQSTKILERSIHQTVFNPQIWWFRWIIPISAFMIAIQALSNLIVQLKSFFKRGAEK